MSQEINLATSLKILSSQSHDKYINETSKKQYAEVVKFITSKASSDDHNLCKCDWNGSLLSETIEKLETQGLSVSFIKGTYALDNDYYIISWK